MHSVFAESRDTFWRSLHALNITRILIASLLFLFWCMGQFGSSFANGLFSYCSLSVIYVGLAILFALLALYRRRRFMAQLLSQIIVDIVIIALLHVTAGGIKGGLSILFLFPLASTAILMQLMLALLFASIVTIFLLSETWYFVLLGQPDATITQAGLYGAAFFAAVFVVNRLAAKLIAQEQLAIKRGQDLQRQLAINSLVIAGMDDGVLIVGNDGTIFACNPAAERKLGLAFVRHRQDTRLSDIPYLKPLSDAFLAWHSRLDGTSIAHIEPEAYLIIKPAGSASLPAPTDPDSSSILGIHLRVRFAMIHTEPQPEDRSVIFLQDVARIEHQAQQLKLASMGRLTASIAHEIRNPLASITHASALLNEEEGSPAQKRLLSIIADNASRMDRMIEDILNLSRKAHSQELLVLSDLIADVKASLDEVHGLPRDMIALGSLDSHQVRFDPMHLREVLLNLLTNALRYASGQPGSIAIHAVTTSKRLELHVQDDGPSITPQIRAHLFEPFYTTSSQGTGLGLYLARELCSNNGAALDYEFHADSPNDMPKGRFVITFAAPNLTQEGFSQ